MLFFLRKIKLRLLRQRCKHLKITDEPPTCSYCGAWVCAKCRVDLISPIGLCYRCADFQENNMKSKKQKPKQPRNWNAVNAHNRKAGAMKDKRKEADWKKEYVVDYANHETLEDEIRNIKTHIDEMLTDEDKKEFGISNDQLASFQVFRLLEALVELKRKV